MPLLTMMLRWPKSVQSWWPSRLSSSERILRSASTPAPPLAGARDDASAWIRFDRLHADHIFVTVDDGERTDIMLREKPHRFGNLIIRFYGHDVADHYIQRFHICLPPLRLFIGAPWSKGRLGYRRVTTQALL
jgi:hypothetical protein